MLIKRRLFIITASLVMATLGTWASGVDGNPAQKSRGVPRRGAARGMTNIRPPSQPAPPQDEYVVGEADVLRITVWKEPELTQTVVVRPDGNISLPLVNEMKIGGMTPTQIQQLLEEKLKAFVTNPRVNVSVTEIHSKMFYIEGEVVKPGVYPIVTPITVLQALAAAGGLTPYAKRRDILVVREVNGKQVRYKVDYLNVIQGKRPEENISLRAGDTVVVP